MVKLIFPFSISCETDSFTIDDGISGVRLCGNVKSDLIYESCSQTIILSLKTGATGSSLYKGVKLFYEVVDKPSDFVCPTATSTVNPSSTTTSPLPSYAVQGVASPTQTKAFCKNNVLDILFGSNIACPKDYVIVIRRTFYGISKSSECFYKYF